MLNYNVPDYERTFSFHYDVRKARAPAPRWVTWQGRWAAKNATGPCRAEEALAYATDLPNMDELCFRDPATFRAGGLHENVNEWDIILSDSDKAKEVHDWIKHCVDVPSFFVTDELGQALIPPPKIMANSPTCREHVPFICKAIVERVATRGYV